MGRLDCGQKQVGFEVERLRPGVTERTRALGQFTGFYFAGEAVSRRVLSLRLGPSERPLQGEK